jgi:hypothetical protein
MNADNDDAVLADGPWPDQLDGTDVEFLLREESVVQFGNGLYALAALAERHVAEYDELSATEIAAQSISGRALPPEIRELASQRLAAIMESIGQDWDARIAAAEPVGMENALDPFGWAAEHFGQRPDRHIEAIKSAFAGLPANASTLGYLAQYAAASDRTPRLPAMRRALLVTAVSNAEVTISGILNRILHDREGGSWQSPERDKAISKIMRGGIEEWEKNFPAKVDIYLPSMSCDWAAVKEIWARRNVLVHRGGIADQKYCQLVSGTAQGTHLEVDGEYLCTAIDLICGFVLGIVYTAWAASPDRRPFIGARATAQAIVAEAEHRWPLAENLYMISALLEESDEGTRSQVSGWLARVHWRGPDSVIADVTAWDTSSLPPAFTLARLILTGETDDALEMIPQLIKEGEISRDNLDNWPLFDSIRDHQAFQQILTRFGS